MAPSQGLRPGHIRDPKIAALFNTKDPEARFVDLKEIGHGSFGAVYYAYDKEAGETVAIKKMSYSGKQAADKWADIMKEVTFLTTLKHPHIVEYRVAYLRDHTCWLVMEYCIGSAADLVDVLRKGLREVEIAAICHSTLEALCYIHSLGRIHRDVKAGNILITDSGTVKLADFGSASLASPAHTFIGTPFFMAPEVILAMDEGSYSEKADIWSLGITCIELAERRPPLFNMNAMSALYHIAQNDPPSLEENPETTWSSTFNQFIQQTLRKDPDDRMSSLECTQHAFIKDACAPQILSELVIRTKRIVRQLDNSQYRKMRKLMYFEEANGNDNDRLDSGADSVSCGGGDSLERRGTDTPSSRSGSLNSIHSMQSSKETQDKEEERDPTQQEERRERTSIKDDVATLRKSKFSTLRTTKLISQEQEEYKKENNLYEQMNGYKRLRQNLQKELKSLEERCAQEMETLKSRLDREYEGAMALAHKERIRLRIAHQNEVEKRKKEVEDGEKKLKKQTVAKQQHELRAFANCQLKEYKHKKEQAKMDLRNCGLPKGEVELRMKEVKMSLARQKQTAEAAFEERQRAEADAEMAAYRRVSLNKTHSMEQRIDDEEAELEIRLADAKDKMLWAQHMTTTEMERNHLKELHHLKEKHERMQHEAEMNNQCEYETRATDELRKRHAMQCKQQPRELKMKEQLIRKQYRQAVKTQTRQFKVWHTQLMAAAGKEEQKEISQRLKDEQKRKMAILGVQYEHQIESMVQEKTVTLDKWQEEQQRTLAEKLDKEMKELKTYQATQHEQLKTLIAKERLSLEEKQCSRQSALERRIADQRTELQSIRNKTNAAREERHAMERSVLERGGHTTAL